MGLPDKKELAVKSNGSFVVYITQNYQYQNTNTFFCILQLCCSKNTKESIDILALNNVNYKAII